MQDHRASDFTLAELAALWNRGYAGYFVPVRFSEAQMAAHLRCGGIDLTRSLVWSEGGEPFAFSYLGVRGERGWIGGFGIAPEARGRGLSYELFARHVATVRESGLQRVQLEVFTENWARRVYERAAFVVTRRVAVLAGQLPVGDGADGDAEVVDATSLLGHHARLHARSEPAWNREAEWVRGSVEVDRLVGLGVGDAESPSAVAWVREDGDGSIRVIDAAAEDDASARALAAGMVARWGGRTSVLVNEPEGTPVTRALAGVGLGVGREQFEMHLGA